MILLRGSDFQMEALDACKFLATGNACKRCTADLDNDLGGQLLRYACPRDSYGKVVKEEAMEPDWKVSQLLRAAMGSCSSRFTPSMRHRLYLFYFGLLL